MTDNTPRTHDSDDAHADGAPPTESITDEVKAAAAVADAQIPDAGAKPAPSDSPAEDLQDEAVEEGAS